MDTTLSIVVIYTVIFILKMPLLRQKKIPINSRHIRYCAVVAVIRLSHS